MKPRTIFFTRLFATLGMATGLTLLTACSPAVPQVPETAKDLITALAEVGFNDCEPLSEATGFYYVECYKNPGWDTMEFSVMVGDSVPIGYESWNAACSDSSGVEKSILIDENWWVWSWGETWGSDLEQYRLYEILQKKFGGEIKYMSETPLCDEN